MITRRHDLRAGAVAALHWLTLVALLLGGCGFHLRGSDAKSMPFQTAFVSGGGDAVLMQRLRDALQQSGVSLADSEGAAEVVFRVGRVTSDSRALTVGKRGDIEEYELRFAVDITFTSGAGDVLQPLTTIEFFNDYSYDKNSVLAKEEEREMLIGDMRQAAVREILRRAARLRGGDGAGVANETPR
jgi:LPS-assembly lipoprotein